MRINRRGIIVNEASCLKIQKCFRAPVLEIRQSILDKFTDVTGIYLRGSVSEGKASPFLSDLDLVVFRRKPITADEIAWLAQFSEEKEKRYPIFTDVDITILTWQELQNNIRYRNLQVYLKTQSCLLYGKDRLSEIPPMVVGKELAVLMFGDMEQELGRVQCILRGIGDDTYLGRHKDAQFWCRWMMRSIVRSAMGMVMTRKKIYSPDLRECLKGILAIHPELREGMEQVMKWELNPTADTTRVLCFLDDFLPVYLPLLKKELS